MKTEFESYYCEKYPLSSKYPREWMFKHQMGPNSLWLTEWLISKMTLKKEMRILDLACGTAMSSIFLAKEVEGTIWAHDLWISPSDNWKRICESNLQGSIFPIYGEADTLPFAENFFEAIICIDAFQYFGRTDEGLDKIVKLLEPAGEIAVVVPGFRIELSSNASDILKSLKDEFQTPSWWKSHWEKNDSIELQCVDVLEEGRKEWLDFLTMQIDAGVARQRDFDDKKMLLSDDEKNLCFIRLVAKKL